MMGTTYDGTQAAADDALAGGLPLPMVGNHGGRAHHVN